VHCFNIKSETYPGGSCKVYDYAWQDWAVGQVERVWDLMDISILKAAKEGLDPSYKTSVYHATNQPLLINLLIVKCGTCLKMWIAILLPSSACALV
jgi:hypothetical protein